MVDQAEIHRMAKSEDVGERKKAAEELKNNFAILKDKKQAWDDLHRLTSDTNSYVRWRAVDALWKAFSHVPDKKQAWDDLHQLTFDKDSYVRRGAAYAFESAFSHVSDKKQAWEDLHRLTSDTDSYVRWRAAYALGSAFSHVSDKKQAWEDLIRLTSDTDSYVRWRAVDALWKAFSHVSDKKQAWVDLIRLTSDTDGDVRRGAAYALGSAFSHVPDKKQAWEDLIRLTSDTGSDMRWDVVNALESAFSHVSDKKQAWEDLHRLTSDTDSYVRRRAVDALWTVFSHVSDKKQAWEDLHRLTSDTDCAVRRGAADALGSAFSHFPDKKQAWEDLLRLTSDTDSFVRWGAANALGSAYSHVPDKKQAWDDLIRLTSDTESFVRRGAADALGSAFSYVSDKKQAWDDLIRLISDTDSDVRASAYHSLGKASIFKASNAENDIDLKKEMEAAIGYFEKSSQQNKWSKPAKFCLPLYRSFYTLTFNKEETEAEVEKYIAEAKSAVEGSESKENLLKAVENLGNALKEVQKAQDFNEMKSDLNAYRRYCERACELLDTTEEKAPGASRLIRKGLPIIDERIKGIIAEIQEKAKALCRKTKDTSLEPLGIETNEKAKQLSEFDYLSNEIVFNKIISGCKEFCDFIPVEKRGEVCAKLKNTENMELLEKGQIIFQMLNYFQDNMDIPRIKNIPIGIRKEKIIKIAAAQLNFKLSTDTFPPELYEKDKVKSKVINAIIKARDNEVNILCIPELCICEEWLPEIKNECGCMILITGSFYDKENHNLCQVICDSNMDIPPQLKFHPSAFEDSKIAGTRMVRGNKLVYVYETGFGSFSVLICRDFGNFVSHLRGKVDIIFVPSYNSANERFHKEADNHVTNNPSYILISNTALYGGTSIFGQLNKGYFPVLVQKKYKKKGDSSYKLCEIEAKKEGMIIAEFDLDHKSPQLQTTINPDEEIIPVQNIQIIEL